MGAGRPRRYARSTSYEPLQSECSVRGESNPYVPHRIFAIDSLPVPAIIGSDFGREHHVESSFLPAGRMIFRYGDFDLSEVVPDWEESEAPATPAEGSAEQHFNCVADDGVYLSGGVAVSVCDASTFPEQAMGEAQADELVLSPHQVSFLACQDVRRKYMGAYRTAADIGSLPEASLAMASSLEDYVHPGLEKCRGVGDLKEMDQSQSQLDLDARSAKVHAAFLEQWKDSVLAPPDFTDRSPLKVGDEEFLCHLEVQPDAVMPQSRPFRRSRYEAEDFHRVLQDLLDRGVLERGPAKSTVAAFLVGKKDETGKRVGSRLVADFRPLNKLLVVHRQAIPNILSVIEAMEGAKILSNADIKEAFHQLRLDKESTQLCGVQTPLGTLRYTRLAMGMSVSPFELERVVEAVLRPITAQEALPGCNFRVQHFFDDLLVASTVDDVDEHVKILDQVFERLKRAQLHLKPSKLSLFRRQQRVLGYILCCDEGSGTRVLLDKEKANIVWREENPTNVRGIKQFLGKVGAWRSHIPDFTSLALPLTNLLGKTDVVDPVTKKKVREATPWKWGEEQAQAVKDLKMAMLQAPILFLPSSNPTEFRVHVDASDYSIGGTLEEKVPGPDGQDVFRLIQVFSKKLKGYEIGYHSGKKELLALKLAVRAFSWLLRFRPQNCLLLTDNSAARYIQSKNPLQVVSDFEKRARAELASFDLQWLPGTQNVAADALSRPLGVDFSPLRILDLCAGIGTTLEALRLLAESGELVCQKNLIYYCAVEREPHARACIVRKYEAIVRDYPGLFASPFSEGIFPYGHNMTQLVSDDEEAIHPRFEHDSFDMVILGAPCQPFSRLNKHGRGLRDPRQMFHQCHRILRFLRGQGNSPNLRYLVECAEFGPKHQEDLKTVERLFRDFQDNDTCLINLSSWLPQSRTRRFWSNVPIHEDVPAAGTRTYAAFLGEKGTPINRRPDQPAATVVASVSSMLRTEGYNDYRTPAGDIVSPSFELEESLQGLQVGDTEVDLPRESKNYEAVRRRLIGNALSPLLLRHFIRKCWGHKRILGEPASEDATVAVLAAQPDFFSLLSAAVEEDTQYQTLRARVVSGSGGDRYAISGQGHVLFRGRYVIPVGQDNILAAELRQRLIELVHLPAHRGVQNALEQLKGVVHWRGMKATIEAYIGQCEPCRLGRNSNLRRQGQIHGIPPPGRPGEVIQCDFVELPSCAVFRHGRELRFDNLLVIRDCFSKYLILVPTTKRVTSEELGRIMLSAANELGNFPRKLITDRGSVFTSHNFRHFTKRLGIRQAFTTAYRPAADGGSERAVRSTLEVLRTMLLPTTRNGEDGNPLASCQWPDLCPLVAYLINNHTTRSTGHTPSMLTHGRAGWLPLAGFLDQRLEPQTPAEYQTSVQAFLQEAWEKSQEAILKMNQEMGARHTPVPQRQFSVGDRVLVQELHHDRHGVEDKLKQRQIGPFIIAEDRGSGAFRLQRDGARVQQVYNQDRLLPWPDQVSAAEWPLGLLRVTDPEVPHEMGPNGPHLVLHVDWSTVPPRYRVQLHPHEPTGIEDIEECEITAGWATEAEAPGAFLRWRREYLREHNLADLPNLHSSVPAVGSPAYNRYRNHKILLEDASADAIGPHYVEDEAGNLVLTRECRRRVRALRHLRNEQEEGAESDSDSQETAVAGPSGEYDGGNYHPPEMDPPVVYPDELPEGPSDGVSDPPPPALEAEPEPGQEENNSPSESPAEGDSGQEGSSPPTDPCEPFPFEFGPSRFTRRQVASRGDELVAPDEEIGRAGWIQAIEGMVVARLLLEGSLE